MVRSYGLTLMLVTCKIKHLFVSETSEEVDGQFYAIEAYWGEVTEPDNYVVKQEALTCVRPAALPSKILKALTQMVPKTKIIPNKTVTQATGDQYERWKRATENELQAFLKGTWKTPTDQMQAKCFAAKRKVVTQLLVFSLKPMTADKRVAGMTGDEYEKKTCICLNHEGFQVQNSTTNADVHLLRLLLAVHAHPNNVLASLMSAVLS